MPVSRTCLRDVVNVKSMTMQYLGRYTFDALILALELHMDTYEQERHRDTAPPSPTTVTAAMQW
jgi:hypothetical protein